MTTTGIALDMDRVGS